MRCLITGVAGFIGSTLAERLLKLGHSVVGVDCFTDYYPRKIKENNISPFKGHQNFSFIEGDLLSIDLLKLLSGIDWIFHQAAQAGVRRSWGSYFDTYTRNNILTTQRILETAKELCTLKKIVYASSSSIYGNAEAYPTKESATPKPVSPYGVTKLAAEHLTSLYAHEFGLPTVSLRYFTVYGPRQRPDMGFYRFIAAGLLQQELTVFGDGEQSRDFTFIDDIVTANILAAEKGEKGDIFNLGGGTQAKINQVLDTISDGIGTKLKIKKVERQVGDARHTGADTALAKKKLGFSPSVTLKDGIYRQIEWLKTCKAEGLIA